MHLDVDRVAEALLEGTMALIAKELAPLSEANAVLAERNATLEARLADLEARDDALAASVAAIPAAKDFTADIEAVRAEIPVAPDLSGLATKADVDAVRAEMPVVPEPVDLSCFVTREAMEAVLPDKRSPLACMEDLAALRAEIPSIDGLARKSDIPEAPDLSEFVTKATLAEAIEAVPQPDLSGFVTREAMEAAIPVAPDLSGYALKSDIPGAPDLSDFATKAELGDVRDAIPSAPDLSGLATKADVDGVMASIPSDPDLSGYALKSDIPVPETPDLTPFATREEVAKAVSALTFRQNDDGELIVKLATGETFNIGKVRGDDGIGFENARVEDGERKFVLVLEKGNREVRAEIAKPAIIDRGVYKEGTDYEAGDGISYGGDFWIAQQDTKDRPGTSKAWRLAVRKGRDAR